MDAQTIVAMLKYAGFLLAAASSTWALIAKTTFEDENKRKRLTPAGYISIVIIVGSALVSAVSFGFEGLLKQGEARLTASRAQEAKRAAEFETAQREQAEARRDSRLREQTADARATAAEQRTLAVTIAAEQRDRQLALARQFGLGARENLQKTGAALAEIGCALQPIDYIEIEVTWRLHAPLPLSAEWVRRSGRIVAEFEENEPARDFCHEGVALQKTGGRLISLNVPRGSCFFPDDFIAISELTAFMSANLSIFGKASEKELRRTLSGRTTSYIGSIGDLAFEAREKSRNLIFYPTEQWLEFTNATRIAPREMTKNGAVVSIPDLEASTILVAKGGPRLDLKPGASLHMGTPEQLQRTLREPRVERVTFFFKHKNSCSHRRQNASNRLAPVLSHRCDVQSSDTWMIVRQSTMQTLRIKLT